MTRPGKPVANIARPPVSEKSTALLLAESLTEHCRFWSNTAAEEFQRIERHRTNQKRTRHVALINASMSHRLASTNAFYFRDRAIEAWRKVT